MTGAERQTATGAALLEWVSHSLSIPDPTNITRDQRVISGYIDCETNARNLGQ